jgi:uncharacterized protein YegP (UPF0339 family)
VARGFHQSTPKLGEFFKANIVAGGPQSQIYLFSVLVILIGIEMPEPVFEWYVDKVGKYRFRLKAANGEMIAISEGYASKQGCVDGIESVRKNAPIAKIVEAKEKVE